MTIYLIIAIATIPGMPRKPETIVVITLIGICRLTAVPKVFSKNKKSAPTTSFIQTRPINRIGLNETPNNNKNKIIPTIIEIMTTEFKQTPLQKLFITSLRRAYLI